MLVVSKALHRDMLKVKTSSGRQEEHQQQSAGMEMFSASPVELFNKSCIS